MNDEMALLNTKLDALIEKVEQQADQLSELQALNTNLEPLKIITTGIHQQSEMMCAASDSSLAFLSRRVYEKSNILIKTLDRLEALMDLVDEAEFLGKQVFSQAVDSLEAAENAGYFTLAEEGGKVLVQTLGEIKPDDIKAVGETVPAMIQGARVNPEDKDTSFFSIIKSLFDPKVRKGLVRMLNILKVLGQ